MYTHDVFTHTPCTLGWGSWEAPTLRPCPRPSPLASWHRDRECTQVAPIPAWNTDMCTSMNHNSREYVVITNDVNTPRTYMYRLLLHMYRLLLHMYRLHVGEEERERKEIEQVSQPSTS